MGYVAPKVVVPKVVAPVVPATYYAGYHPYQYGYPYAAYPYYAGFHGLRRQNYDIRLVLSDIIWTFSKFAVSGHLTRHQTNIKFVNGATFRKYYFVLHGHL